MLKAHMDSRERVLAALARVPANAGHSLHKGTPRESFVREFLEAHLPASLAIGTGEIIDANSLPNQPRRQHDVVIYWRNYPKLNFGGDIDAFLIESVLATIEVKSTLSQSDMNQACSAARQAKSLTSNTHRAIEIGYRPPKILNYVVAFDGPTSIKTVVDWFPGIHAQLGVQLDDLPTAEETRTKTASPSVDGVFVMERGFCYFDNVPVGLAKPEIRSFMPKLKWVHADMEVGSLLMFFTLLQVAASSFPLDVLNPSPYLARAQFFGVRYSA